MKTIVNYKHFEGEILFYNIIIDAKTKTGTLSLSTKAKRKRKFTHQDDVNFTVTPDLFNWFTKRFNQYITVDGVKRKTGKMITGFQSYLEKRDIEFKPAILRELIFESMAKSEDYYSNPFKLVRLNDKNILTLVNAAPKARRETLDINTGEIKVKYYTQYITLKDGSRVKAFTGPKKYSRLIVQEFLEVNADA